MDFVHEVNVWDGYTYITLIKFRDVDFENMVNFSKLYPTCSRIHQISILITALPQIQNRWNGVEPRYNGGFRFVTNLTKPKALPNLFLSFHNLIRILSGTFPLWYFFCTVQGKFSLVTQSGGKFHHSMVPRFQLLGNAVTCITNV